MNVENKIFELFLGQSLQWLPGMVQVLQQKGSHLDGNFLTRKKDLLELLVIGERLDPSGFLLGHLEDV